MRLLIVACFVALAYAGPVELIRKSQSHAAPDYMNFKCDDLKNGFYADRVRGCYQYYECEGGVKKNTYNCDDGKVFNEDLWACDLPDLYSCPSAEKRSLDLAKKSQSHGMPDWMNFKCDGLDDGFYADLMRGCHQYYECKGGQKTTFFCKDNTVFNQGVNACYPKTDFSCPALEKREEAPEQMAFGCANRKNGFYKSRTCAKFHRCDDGKTFTFNCAPGTSFDTSLNICNHASLVNKSCTSRPNKEQELRAEEKVEKLRELLRQLKDIK